MVTGSGFDLIQTAFLKVQADNSIAFEVCLPLLFWLSLLIIYLTKCIFHVPPPIPTSLSSISTQRMTITTTSLVIYSNSANT